MISKHKDNDVYSIFVKHLCSTSLIESSMPKSKKSREQSYMSQDKIVLSCTRTRRATFFKKKIEMYNKMFLL